MGKRSDAETRANKAKHRATHFFQSISDKRRAAREAKVKEAKAKEEDRIRQEVDRQWQAYIATLPPTSIPRPPQPALEPKVPKPTPGKPEPIDPATRDFLKWCFSKEEFEEDDTPYWAKRNPLLYGKRR